MSSPAHVIDENCSRQPRRPRRCWITASSGCRSCGPGTRRDRHPKRSSPGVHALGRGDRARSPRRDPRATARPLADGGRSSRRAGHRRALRPGRHAKRGGGHRRPCPSGAERRVGRGRRSTGRPTIACKLGPSSEPFERCAYSFPRFCDVEGPNWTSLGPRTVAWYTLGWMMGEELERAVAARLQASGWFVFRRPRRSDFSGLRA